MRVADLLDRARSQLGRGIRYKMGGGSFKADRHTCADGSNASDCSAFVCWSMGVDKVGDYPYLLGPGEKPQPPGQWYGTENIFNDAVHISMGLFQVIDRPAVGAVVVYPTTWKGGKASPPGHVGIVTALAADSSPARVLHCSSGNFKGTGDAVGETAPSVFTSNPSTIYAWCARVEIPQTGGAKGAKTLSVAVHKPVRFCVVATGPTGASITAAAKSVAAPNPVGRKVVVSGDPDYPDAGSIASWTTGVQSPGAVVLRPDGTLSQVLDETDAAKKILIEDAFLTAAGFP